MTFRPLCWASLAALLLACPPLARAQAPVKDTGVRDAQALAEKIDQYFAKRWAEANAKLAAQADETVRQADQHRSKLGHWTPNSLNDRSDSTEGQRK